jgi:cytochrome c55X
MRLTGGLGPALTPERMSLLPLDSLVAVILHGRPGTPMPPWAPMLSEAEARWIAQRLQQGFPQEPLRP